MDLEIVRSEIRGPWDPQYVDVDDLTAEEAGQVPDAWKALIGQPEGHAGPAVAAQWRRCCPQMPRVANYLERNTLRMVLVRRTAPHHYVREFQGGVECTNAHSTEIALTYVLRASGGRRRCQLWSGRVPHQGALPSWWPAVEAVTGTLSTELHDGFMEKYWNSGILAVRDMHTVSQRWVEYIDPAALRIRVERSATDRTAVPREEWPDFTQLHVVAEHTTMMAWAVDASTGAGWGDGYDTMHLINDLAESVEDMLGTQTGAIRRNQF